MDLTTPLIDSFDPDRDELVVESYGSCTYDHREPDRLTRYVIDSKHRRTHLFTVPIVKGINDQLPRRLAPHTARPYEVTSIQAADLVRHAIATASVAGLGNISDILRPVLQLLETPRNIS